MPTKITKPYLTIPEVADQLDCTTRNVYKLIDEGKLPALKRSERKTLVPAQALLAYQRRLNGGPSIASKRRQITHAELQALFDEHAAGRSPAEFYEAFKRGEIEDTSENMTLLVQAIALGGGAAKPSASKTGDPFAFAYAARSRR